MTLKIASADWSTVDFGGVSDAEAGVDENVAEQLGSWWSKPKLYCSY